MKSWKYTYISWYYWNEIEIDFLANWCWSSRWIFRPPGAKKNKKPCNKHDVRYALWGSIFDKFKADLILWLEIILENLTHFWGYWFWNILWIIEWIIYWIAVWFFWTIIDIVMLIIFWKESAFQFWVKKTKEEALLLK